MAAKTTKKSTKKTTKKSGPNTKKREPVKIYGIHKKNRPAPPKTTTKPNEESRKRVRMMTRDAILEICYTQRAVATISRGCGLTKEASMDAIREVCDPIIEALEKKPDPAPTD